MMKEYSLELEKYSEKNNYLYINPNEYLENKVKQNKNKYLVDYIHPNSNDGIELYCEGIFLIAN